MISLSKDVFFFPHNENFIIYVANSGLTALVNQDTIKLINSIKQKGEIPEEMNMVKSLLKLGVLTRNENSVVSKKTTIEFKPTSVTFLPSYKCNLKCSYCYSNGGENAKTSIDTDAAFAAIDVIMKNASKSKSKEVTMGFHGGGEPLHNTNIDFIRETIEYFKYSANKNKLNSKISCTTNGLGLPKYASLIKSSFTRVNLSFDGTPEIQNQQRPKIDGSPSYPDVLESIEFMEREKISYGIRATITKNSSNYLLEIFEHFAAISKSVKTYHFEPLFECGRCLTTKTEAPDPITFTKNFLNAQKTATKRGIELYYSAASIGRKSNYFCGAVGKNFFITPECKITTCLEACRDDEKINEIFHVGFFNRETLKYVLDRNKIAFLQKREVNNIRNCLNCFCKYTCSGDCLIKVLKQTGDIFSTDGNKRCEINRSLTIDQFETLYKNQN